MSLDRNHIVTTMALNTLLKQSELRSLQECAPSSSCAILNRIVIKTILEHIIASDLDTIVEFLLPLLLS